METIVGYNNLAYWYLLVSYGLWTALDPRVSSAKDLNLVAELVPADISLISTKNSIGPNTVPCGTPLITSDYFE